MPPCRAMCGVAVVGTLLQPAEQAARNAASSEPFNGQGGRQR